MILFKDKSRPHGSMERPLPVMVSSHLDRVIESKAAELMTRTKYLFEVCEVADRVVKSH
jgi:hypothetical protein